MEQFFITLGVALLLLMLATLYRVIQGPTVIDRILGVNVIGIKTTVLIIIVGTLHGRVEMFIDIALAYALLNFITTIAAARFFQRAAQPVPKEAAEAQAAPSVTPVVEPAEGSGRQG
ncbi:MAG: monovalent cation/H+ antiporter complex subunit F [Desulfurivibrionaceae bacterium]|nr:monovalent cation/H+ antiporter complex subunit F [Desulfurivibrionaceae bacterium]